jgi:hypothetical protein
VAIVSHVNFNFESKVYYEFNKFFAIEIKLDTPKTLFSQIFTFEKDKFKINFTFKIKINMRNDGHFGQLKIVSKKFYIFGWNVLRSMMFQLYFRKFHQILIEKMNF